MGKETPKEAGVTRDVAIETKDSKEAKDPLKDPKDGKDLKETKTKSAKEKVASLLNISTSTPETAGKSSE